MVSLVSKLAFSLVLFNLLCDVSTPKIASLNFGARLSINHYRSNMSFKRSSLTASIFWNNLCWFGLPTIFYHWFIFSFLNFATTSLKWAIKKRAISLTLLLKDRWIRKYRLTSSVSKHEVLYYKRTLKIGGWLILKSLRVESNILKGHHTGKARIIFMITYDKNLQAT